MPVLAQTPTEEDFRTYNEAPRIILRPQRMRLLKRERERQSIRWQQFESLMNGGAKMAEDAIAKALYGVVTGERKYCDAAAAAAPSDLRSPGNDLRSLAIVMDWCGRDLSSRIKPLIAATANAHDVPTMRARILAAAALADADAKLSEAVMKDAVVRWWRGEMVPAIRAGKPVPRETTLALFELLHVVRDNLNTDLRDPVQGFFRDLPIAQMLGYYPAAFPGPENEYRIPFFTGDGDPDLTVAAMSRAAELSMVAYDNNALESQSLQGWLLQDRYLMRGTFGIVYEFLWANPYQPGITYHYLPNLFHDRRSGRLFVRSSWEEDASFFCYYEGKGQFFDEGKRKLLDVVRSGKPVSVGGVTLLVGRNPMKFELDELPMIETETGRQKEPEANYFLVALKPATKYDIEVDNEEMHEEISDAGGIVSLRFISPRKMSVRLKEAAVQ